ncbi:MAG: serine hydrolase [Ruminococcus sp.]|nr:serine hydrolase [Ruminococcus sp.]
MKIRPIILTAIIAASLALGSCGDSEDSSSKADTSSAADTAVTNTAASSAAEESAAEPVSEPELEPVNSTAEEIVDDESAFMKAAPAYDTEKAKSYISAMPQIRELLTGAKADSKLTSFGKATAPEDAVKKVKDEIAKLTADGHKVSLIMIDLETQSGVAYRPDIPMCTQSTIKAVYLGSVLDSHPEAYQEHWIDFRKAIVNSNNDSYLKLYELYGKEPLEKWCEEVGVDKGFAASSFPRKYSAKDMMKLWTKLYCFLNSDEMQHSEFASYYADSACSATKMMLGTKYPVQTKAGWESGKDTWKNYDPRDTVPDKYCDGDPTNDESATNDTGVVYTDGGPYIFVIYTDIPFSVYYDYIDPNPLNGLVVALNELQQGLRA